MDSELQPWLTWRALADLALWAVTIAVFLLYLWSLAFGPVSTAEPAQRTAPVAVPPPVPGHRPDAGSGAPLA